MLPSDIAKFDALSEKFCQKCFWAMFSLGSTLENEERWF